MGKPFTWSTRVYYEDTDVSGVVYHANYLCFFERARTEWLRSLGFGQQQLMREQQVAFTVASLQVDFFAPAKLDDELDISVNVLRHGRASMVLKQEMRIRGQDEPLLCSLQCRIGCVDSDSFRPAAMPATIIEEMNK